MLKSHWPLLKQKDQVCHRHLCNGGAMLRIKEKAINEPVQNVPVWPKSDWYILLRLRLENVIGGAHVQQVIVPHTLINKWIVNRDGRGTWKTSERRNRNVGPAYLLLSHNVFRAGWPRKLKQLSPRLQRSPSQPILTADDISQDNIYFSSILNDDRFRPDLRPRARPCAYVC